MKTTNIITRNNSFQHFQVLKTNRKKRYQYKEFLVEGVRSINKAVEKNWHIKSFLFGKDACSDWAKNLLKTVQTEENYCLSKELLQELSGKTDTSELLAVIEMREDIVLNHYISENPFLVLFDRPSNKGNLGTLIRSCDALGADLLIITGHSVDLYDPDVIVSAMGSFFNLPVIRISEQQKLWELIEKMKKNYPSFKTVGTTAHRQTPIYKVDFTTPVMLMIGNETMGLSQTLKEKCDITCTIPMAEQSYASSFNVSCAASIMMYELTRQRSYDPLD